MATASQFLAFTLIVLAYSKHLMLFGHIWPESTWNWWHKKMFFHLVVNYAPQVPLIRKSNILSILAATWGDLKKLYASLKTVTSVQTFILPLLLIDTGNILHIHLMILKTEVLNTLSLVWILLWHIWMLTLGLWRMNQ